MLLQLLWIPFSYLCGALPLSVWIGRMAGKDIRQYGDGNPGATNVLRAAGWKWFALAICADFSKAAVPVGLAHYVFHWTDWPLFFIALAPSVGHTFSPFLGWQGGKALATMLGAWIGLTLWELPVLLLTGLTVGNFLVGPAGWAVLFTAVPIFGYLLWRNFALIYLAIFLGQIALVIYTHLADLRQRPYWKPSRKKSEKAKVESEK
jgi:acyl phosphate:glycerol-3-phosphate acyltransferase